MFKRGLALTRDRTLVLLAAIIVIAGVLVYANSLSSPFIFDDQTAIIDNQRIRQLWPLSVPLSPLRETPVAGRPIVNLTFALNYAAGGMDTRGYRLTNLAVHLLAALTLFGLVRRTLLLPSVAPTFVAQATNLAWIAALIWMLHPLQTETIDYVTQRTESMMGLFYLLTLYCSVRALAGRQGRWQAAAIVACATGMACKESMATAPLTVVLFDYAFADRALLRKAHRTRLYVGLASTWVVLATLMASVPRTTVGFDTKVSGWTYLLNQAPILLTYLRLTFWPRNLVLDYGVPQPLTLIDVWLPMLAVTALAVVVLMLLARRPQVGFLGAWCFITLAPTSSIIPIATEVAAERRMYLPLAALVVLIVLGVYRAWIAHVTTRPHHVGLAGALCLCLALGVATMQRNREYGSKVSILQTTVDRRPHPRAYQMLAVALNDAGRRQEAIQYLERAKDDPVSSFMLGVEHVSGGELARGAEELERFIQLAPTHVRVVDAREALGRAYSALNQLDQAAAQLTEVVRLQPGKGPAHAYLGEVLLRQGRTADGVRQFQISAELQPGNPDALRLLGIAQGQTGQLDAAVTTFKRVIELDPLNARGHYLLGTALAASGQVAAAVPHFARAVELDPQDTKARADLQRAESYVR
ncbi:MAG TPA: tetratricopeptide repeat protein [Vicinamibacterales bacterium]|nr:tetratricopeptide repeat protein [Vicinamibacterales bacterium]